MKKNQIILLSDIPTHDKQIRLSRPIGCYVIATSLEKAGYSCVVIDWFTKIKNFKEYISNFITEDTEMIAISSTFLQPTGLRSTASTSEVIGLGNTTNFANQIAELTEEKIKNQSLYLWFNNNSELLEWINDLKSVIPETCKIVIGGARIMRIYSNSSYIEENYALKQVDYLMLGECDESIVEAVSGNPDIINKNGLKFIFSGRYDKEIPVTKYKKEHCIDSKEWVPLEVSRGCFFNCRFCNYEKSVYRKKDMKQLYYELLNNYETLGITGYNITSDCFNDSAEFVTNFANTVAKLPFKIEWSSYARLDLFNKQVDLMDAMLESGFKAGWFGLDTLSQEAGKWAGKGLSPERVKELLHILRQKASMNNGLWIMCYLIIGLPHETSKSLDSTLDWLKHQNIIDEIQANVLDVAPFIEELTDVIDFSDHVRNPKKYGFTRLEFSPEFYWEHETLNLKQCLDIKNTWREELYDHSYTRFGGSAQAEYPALRALGFTHTQTAGIMKIKTTAGHNLSKLDKQSKNNIKDEVLNCSKGQVEKYHKDLILLNN